MDLGDAEKGPVAEGESHRKGHGVQRKLYLLFFISPTLTYFPPFQNPGNPWGKQGRMLDACGTTAFWIPQHRDDAALGNPMGEERH